MSRLYPLGLFDGYGIEIEYMIADAESLDVLPIADRLLAAVAGRPLTEVEVGSTAWSNELALHVLEIKTNGPWPSLDLLAARFQEDVGRANAILAPMGAALLPTAMHPWMDVHRETRLWPHEMTAVYRTYDAIFDCRGHGWSNLQSTHINLPFADEEEFVRLHASTRVVLPLIPAIAASSPILEGRATGWLDTRLEHYRNNQRKIPEIAGLVIPDPVGSISEYRERILGTVYRAIAPHDPAGILRREWLNSRGAIARFDRGAIEIRLVDIQECPEADLAVIRAIVSVIRALCEERHAPIADLQRIPTEALHRLLLATIRDAEEARVEAPPLLAALGWEGGERPTAGELWRDLLRRLLPGGTGEAGRDDPLGVILEEGVLARRMLRRFESGEGPAAERLRSLFRDLRDGLAAGRIFRA